jgi:hypothetical protein
MAVRRSIDLIGVKSSELEANFKILPEIGYVYALSNYAMSNYIKLGWTARDPKHRVRELNSETSNPARFQIEFYYQTRCAEHHENKLFYLFDDYRIRKRREFFFSPLEHVLEVTMAYFEKAPSHYSPSLTRIVTQTLSNLEAHSIAVIDSHRISWSNQ